MANSGIYTTALMDHNAHPDYKYEMDDATHTHEGINPSCGDELTLSLRVEGGVIEEAAFTGHGCAVSQASADMMADLVTGETIEEARRLCGLFLKMVKGEELTEDDVRREQAKVQKHTDEYVAKVEELLKEKEAEVMEI